MQKWRSHVTFAFLLERKRRDSPLQVQGIIRGVWLTESVYQREGIFEKEYYASRGFFSLCYPSALVYAAPVDTAPSNL